MGQHSRTASRDLSMKLSGLALSNSGSLIYVTISIYPLLIATLAILDNVPQSVFQLEMLTSLVGR